MKRLLLVILLVGLSSGCVARWVGKPVTRLEKEYGRPRSIQPAGDYRIYVYPDDLAGFGQMTFTVDRTGIIRSWCATPNVPGVFGEDIFGTADGGFGTINDNSGNTTTTTTNGGVVTRTPTTPRPGRGVGGVPRGVPGSECR
jgi:hypothetical protein